MFLVSEDDAAQLVGMRDAIDAVEGVFVELHRGEAEVFPVVMGRGPGEEASFGLKSGYVEGRGLIGVKVGSYWPANRQRHIPAHASTTLLLDPATGLPKALIAASHLTSLRTAASDGVAIRCLSRTDSRVVAMVGAGHQSWYELLAVREIRQIDRVLVWNRTASEASRLVERIRSELLLDAEVARLAEAVAAADIVITITSAREPLVERAWVRPGTHISAVGADVSGKQELALDLVANARLFADVSEQSVTLGDYEAACRTGDIDGSKITAIGAVIAGAALGRTASDQITIYDSSGMALQDLAIGALALQNAIEQGRAMRVQFLGRATQAES